MKPKLSLKTLLRTPVKTFLTFLLVAAVSFGLFSQVAEYAMTAREFEDNIGMYYASVSVEAEPASYRKLKFPYYLETDERVNATGIDKLNEQGYKLITAEQTEKIAAMSYVSTVYKRYMTAGAAEDFYRLDDTPKNVTNGTAYSPNSFYDYCARLVVEGTVDRYKDGISDITDPMKMYRVYSISDCRVLAGQAELEDLLLAGDRIEFITVQNEWLGEQFASDSNVPKGERLEDLNLRAGTISIGDRIINVYFGTYKYFGNYIDELLQPGRRYVFTLRYERTGHGLQGQNIGLYDWVTEPWCPAVWDITDAPENYLELEEYAPLKLLTELTNTDIHTLDVVYADDMSVRRQIENGSMKIAEGRWLSTDDTADGADVCVISNIFGLRLEIPSR